MRPVCLIAMLAFCAWSTAGESWDAIFAARLDASSSYREAKLKLRSAEFDYDKFTKPYLPFLTLNTKAGTTIGAGAGGFSGGTIESALTFSEFFGTDLSLELPLAVSKSGEFGLGNPSLSLTRKLFVETEADRQDAEAALIRTRITLRETKDAVRLQLVTDILNVVYYLKLLEANRRDLDVLERVKTATVAPAALREVERRILQARKAILSATGTLSALDPEIKNQAENYYKEILLIAVEWTASVPDAEPKSSESLRAQELEFAAAKERKAFSILPYLPNPSLSVALSYDLGKAALDWGLRLSFSADVLDKGERALNVLKREENAEILRLKLDAGRKSLGDGVRKARENLSALELDRRLKALDIADEEENVNLLQALCDGGYASEEDLVIGQTDLSIERLAAQKIDHDILIQKMKLAQYFSAE